MDIDVFRAITSIVGDVTTIAVLLYWNHKLSRNNDALQGAIIEDWKRTNTRDEMRPLVDAQPITQAPER